MRWKKHLAKGFCHYSEHAVPFVTSQWAIYQNCALTYTLKERDLKQDSS